ncbi:MAG: SLBB domain-containing protein [Kiritimatiellales bacterium]|nr:SLBB domain-containing protein [Kiritimatiellota bacterium]MBL7011861.1 SLBB domain-containing protein [Kiritimatiellales bacterium]
MNKYRIFVVLLTAALFAGCLSPIHVEETGSDSGPLVGLYNLKPLDPLFISLLGIPQEKQIETVVDEYGQITLPYIEEPVQVVGLTISGLEREIQRIYIEGGIYRTVTVNIQTSAKSYFMEGEVNRPQEYDLNRRITLLQAIAAAGGYTDFADNKDVVITRHGENIKVNARDIEKHPEMDIPIEAGDRIKVDRTFY